MEEDKYKDFSFNEETRFRLGFRCGNAAGMEQYKFGWKQSKNFEGSMSPKSNGFVKGFIRSQWRSRLIKSTEIQLEKSQITGDKTNFKKILQRTKESYDRDQAVAFQKYLNEKKMESKNKIWMNSRVKVPFNRKMKIRNKEVDKDR